MGIAKIKIPIYRDKLILIQTKDFTNIPKKYKIRKFNASGYSGLCYRIYDKNKSLSVVILVRENTTPEIIAHESVHCVNYIYQENGIKLDLMNDEPQAYLLGWIIEQCHKYFKIKKK